MKRLRIRNRERKGMARLEQEIREGKKAVEELLGGTSKHRGPLDRTKVNLGLMGSDWT